MNIQSIKKIFLTIFYTSFSSLFYLFLGINSAQAASIFPEAYSTLTTSRFSVRAEVSSVNNNEITIKSTGTTEPDTNTKNLFIGDSICFYDGTSCRNNQTYTVTNVINDTTFVVDSIPTGATTGDIAIISQEAILSTTFKPTSTSNIDKVIIKIPASSNSTAAKDGFPDISKFDTNGIETDPTIYTSLTCASGQSGCTAPTVTKTYSHIQIGTQYYHQFTFTVNSGSFDPSYFYVINIGNASKKLIVPAPSTSHATQRGTAENFVITIQTLTSGGDIIEQADTSITVNDGVFISAYVPISITWTITGIAANQSACNTTTTVTTTSTAVPFGTIYSTNTFFDAAQLHTISTNAPGGYILQVKQDNDLTNVETGTTIPAGNCDGTCSPTTTGSWNLASNNGFGYTLQGTNAVFDYLSGYRTFDSLNYQDIATYNSPISNDTIYTCYRLSVSPTQEAGLYTNTIYYRAYAKF